MFLFIIFSICQSIRPRRPAIQTRFTKKISLPENYNNGFGCDMCTQVIKYIEQLLLDTTVESEIATLVEQLCTSFPSPYDSLCKTVVEQYLPTVLQWLEEGLDSLDVCTKIGLCTSTAKSGKIARIQKRSVKNDLACETCQKMVQYVDTLLQNQTLEEEIEELAVNKCGTLSVLVKDLCKKMVKQYLPTFLQWLEQDIDKINICKFIGFCNDTETTKVTKVRKISLPMNYNNGFGCDMCTKVVQYIEQLLLDTTVETEIATLVEQLCTTFPSPYDSLCKTVVEQYLPSVLQWIEEGLDSLDVCTKIGLCTATKSKSTIRIPMKFISINKYQNNDEVCDTCQQILNRVKELLTNQTIEEEIEENLEGFCSTLKWPMADLCKKLVKQYLPTLIDLAEKDVDPQEICTLIGLCSATSKRMRKNYNRKSVEGCQTCQKWFKWAEDKLDEVTVEGLWKLVSEECPKVPYLKYFCQIINEQNIETLASLILSALPPEQCCEWIKLC